MADAGKAVASAVVGVCLLQVLADSILIVRKLSLLGIKRRLVSIARALTRLCKLSAKVPADCFEKRLWHLLEIERVDRWHLGAQYLAVPASLGLIFNVATRGFIQAATGVKPLDVHEVFGSSFLLAAYVYTGSQFCRLIDRRFSERANSAVVTYVNLGTTVVCGISQAFNTTTPYDYAFAYSWTLCARLLSCMMDGKLTSGILACIAFSLWSLYCRVTFLHGIRGIDCVLEISSTLVICGVLLFGKVSRYELMKATLQAKESRNFKNVGAALLLKTCDAVVQLSEDFCITAPTPSLSALLLRQSNMDGLSFIDLILQRPEVERFLNFMERESGAEDELLLPLRDSGGSAVNVRMMHGHGLDSHDQVFHILGIQEVGEQQDNAMPTGHPNQAAPTLLRYLHDVDAASVSSASSLDVLDEKRSTCSDTVPIDFHCDEEVSIWLHLSGDDHLKIIKCSAALSSIIGLLGSSSHAFERLCPTNIPTFMAWIQGCLNAGRTKVQKFSFQLPGQDKELRALVVMNPFPHDLNDDVVYDGNHMVGMPDTAMPQGFAFKLELLEVKFRDIKSRQITRATASGALRTRPIASAGEGAEVEGGRDGSRSRPPPMEIGRHLADATPHTNSASPSNSATHQQRLTTL